jgi:hypothetical protein
MKSWTSSRTSKPVNKPLEEDAEVVKEDEATTADVEIVVVGEAVAVAEAVVVAVVEEACSEKTKEKPTAQAWFCHDKNGGPLIMKDACEYVR